MTKVVTISDFWLQPTCFILLGDESYERRVKRRSCERVPFTWIGQGTVLLDHCRGGDKLLGMKALDPYTSV